MGKGGSAPAAPAMSKEEKALLQKQTELLARLDAESTSNADLMKRVSGFYNVGADGKLTLNESMVGRQQDLVKAQLDRYEKALAGMLPVSEGTLQRKADEFKLLKENAARRGINIAGDTIDTATSDSTAGVGLLGQFKRSYGLIEDAERRGELAGSVNSGLGILSSAGGTNPGLVNAYGSVAAPYANQRMLEYQSAINNFNYKKQGQAGLLGGAGAIVGGTIGAFTGGPYGALAGANIGGSLGMLGA
ncbi:MAG: hypothetical protein E6Q97_35055 [Desulfurellales bacterium]|jgi:hypothetical protein|nr:MAG: hypothetical protein E6Q97_35055 [Desulfurellales bacterium]